MRKLIIAGALALTAAAVSTDAQSQSSENKTVASSIGVYAFPSKGQTSRVQSKDEADCYEWAMETTGVDPLDAIEDAQRAEARKQQAAQATQGSGLRGGARGAAGGALIGAIAGNAGAGAAIGALTGAIIHRSRSEYVAGRESEHAATKQQATAEQMASFKKAFSSCLEAKNYSVKY